VLVTVVLVVGVGGSVLVVDVIEVLVTVTTVVDVLGTVVLVVEAG